eukprot:scaffold14049_cov190-Isochrysis_galbana.AAC.4
MCACATEGADCGGDSVSSADMCACATEGADCGGEVCGGAAVEDIAFGWPSCAEAARSSHAARTWCPFERAPSAGVPPDCGKNTGEADRKVSRGGSGCQGGWGCQNGDP